MADRPQASALLIRGGPEVMSSVFREEGFGYWSAAFPVILEKHGWLDFAVAEPSVLDTQSALDPYSLVIMAWLPERFWKPAYVEALRDYDGVLFVEGPVPAEAHGLLGVQRKLYAPRLQEGFLSFGHDAQTFAERRFGRTFHPGHREVDPDLVLGFDFDAKPLRLVPKAVVTKNLRVSRQDFQDLDPEDPALSAGRAAISLGLAYRARFTRYGHIFEDPLTNALATLASVRSIRILPDGRVRDVFAGFVRELLRTQAPEHLDDTDGQSGIALAVWALAVAEAAHALEAPELAERAVVYLDDVRGDWGPLVEPSSELRLWRICLALALTDQGQAARRPRGDRLDAFLPASGQDNDHGGVVTRAWLAQSIASLVTDPVPPALAEVGDWLDRLAHGLGSNGGGLPAELEDRSAAEVMLAAGALRRRGHSAAVERLWSVCVNELYDAERGSFRSARVRGGELEPAQSFSSAPELVLGLLDVSDQLPTEETGDVALVAYTPEQVSAWEQPPYWVEPYAGIDDADVFLLTETSEAPLIWRNGRTIATSFQLLAQLVHMHTMHPLPAPFMAHRHVDATVLEYLLFHLLERELGASGGTCAGVGPWPWSKARCVTIRHDVDRLLDAETFERLVGFESENGLAVTWFWLPDRLEPEQVKRLEATHGNEIALHSVSLQRKGEELAAVRASASASSAVVGEALHGAGDSWLGHPSVVAAIDAGLLYTELVPPACDAPYFGFPHLDANGLIGCEPIVGITYTAAIDGRLGERPATEGGPRIYHQVLNHPDLNFERLASWVSELPADDRVDWTCAEVARWWRSTHTREALAIERLDVSEAGVTYGLRATAAVEDLEVRIYGARRDVAAVELDRGARTESADWAPLDDSLAAGVAVKVSLDAGEQVHARVRYAPG